MNLNDITGKIIGCAMLEELCGLCGSVAEQSWIEAT